MIWANLHVSIKTAKKNNSEIWWQNQDYDTHEQSKPQSGQTSIVECSKNDGE